MAKQKSGRVDIECDLHGLTRDEAWIQLQQVVALLRRRKKGRARIIHGCGEVLSEMVYEFAQQAPDIEIEQERNNAGASIIELIPGRARDFGLLV